MININMYAMLINMLNLMHVNIQCYKMTTAFYKEKKNKTTNKNTPRILLPVPLYSIIS